MDTIDEQTIQQFETIIEGILTSGYGIADDFLTGSDVAALADQLHQRKTAGQFRAAGIGNQQLTVQTAIRGDEILWLDSTTATSAESAFLNRIDTFIAYVNRTCYLGLCEFECHYALYPTGTFYKRHLDQFRTDSRRKLSVICYLNTYWKEADGGQLVLYLPANEQRSEQPITINPTGGRLVCFESARLEHEVLPATRERLSITGWLKTA
ncbi:2OG-Fe(II) oxygenase [Spirosoma sp. BT702]|uniref:2OG-Fe(II) oxygenase n=1 Tax=Spirosoma profusum TaxID=2771354 RepID=A0A926Y058_9BACT|nr:2OG-Fe(II) oxygenase [Spirosoma profusum]MBD2699500.1 2OG-Fe(II) oxygenase [Spirosoma profusum]